MPVLMFGTLLPGMKKIAGKTNVFKCDLRVAEDLDITAYIKFVSAKKITAEIVAAICGRAAELDIPQPYLVVADKSLIPLGIDLDCLPEAEGNFVYAIASRDSSGVSFAQQLESKSFDAFSLFAKSAGFFDTIVFDEFIANCDRNLENILWDGQRYFLIDHAHALDMTRWQIPESLTPDRRVSNLLMTAADKWPDDYKKKLLNHAKRVLIQYSKLKIIEKIPRQLLLNLLPATDVSEAIRFLEGRIDYTVEMLCEKAGIKHQPALKLIIDNERSVS